jgi:tetratricopeptide (TPR) repeat protein
LRLDLANETCDLRERAAALNNLGVLAMYKRDFRLARRRFEEAREAAELAEWTFVSRAIRRNLALIALEEGDLVEASRVFEDELRLSRAENFVTDLPWLLAHLGDFALRQGARAKAASLFREALDISVRNALKQHIPAGLFAAAAIAADAGDAADAARLLGAAETLAGSPELYPSNQHKRASSLARDQLGECRFNALRASGGDLEQDQAVDLGMRCLDDMACRVGDGARDVGT